MRKHSKYDACEDCRAYNRKYRRFYDRPDRPVSLDALPWQPGENVHNQLQAKKNSGDISPKPLTASTDRSWVCVWADHGECRRADCSCICHGRNW